MSVETKRWHLKLRAEFPSLWNLLRTAWRQKAEVVNSPKLQLDKSMLNAGQPEIV